MHSCHKILTSDLCGIYNMAGLRLVIDAHTDLPHILYLSLTVYVTLKKDKQQALFVNYETHCTILTRQFWHLYVGFFHWLPNQKPSLSGRRRHQSTDKIAHAVCLPLDWLRSLENQQNVNKFHVRFVGFFIGGKPTKCQQVSSVVCWLFDWLRSLENQQNVNKFHLWFVGSLIGWEVWKTNKEM